MGTLKVEGHTNQLPNQQTWRGGGTYEQKTNNRGGGGTYERMNIRGDVQTKEQTLRGDVHTNKYSLYKVRKRNFTILFSIDADMVFKVSESDFIILKV